MTHTHAAPLWKRAVAAAFLLIVAYASGDTSVAIQDGTFAVKGQDNVWPESLRITALDFEAHRLWFDMGVDEDMQRAMPVAYANGEQTSPIYTTIVTATEMTATEWTAVENSRDWTPNNDGMDGWSWLDDIDTESDKRFFRVAVTREPMTEGDTTSSITTGGETLPDDSEPGTGNVDPSKHMVAISFDDGCSPANNKRIVDALANQGFHATFFFVSDWSQSGEKQDEIRYAYRNGMEIANHTASHPHLVQMSPAEIRQEADKCHAALKSLIGAEPPRLLRPPYLEYNGVVMATLNDYCLVTCSIDTRDDQDANTEQIVQCIKNSLFNGSANGAIVHCHETSSETVAAIEELAPYCKAQGFQIVTISEMFAAKGKPIPYGTVITCL